MASIGDWLEGIGAGTVILIGVLLFFIPEPITSFWGALVTLAGIVLYFLGWWKDRQDGSSSTT